MEVLDKIFDYKINSDTDYYIEETLEEYKLYLKLLEQLEPKLRKAFFRTIKSSEIINNHEMEHEDGFMIQLQMNSNANGMPKTSIDVMTDFVLNNKNMTIKDFEKIHRLLIRGTSDDISRNYPIRNFDTKVYEITDGKERVQYIPPAPEEIQKYLTKLFDFMNNLEDCTEKDIFYKSILEHFYISALQPFGNGNTRMARLIEHSEIFKLSRKTLGSTIEQPALYVSKNHLMTRKTYRDSIARLVSEPTEENFNKWFNYNLNTINEQLYFCNNALKKRII